MSNITEHQISIGRIRKQLHEIAGNPPKINPFSREGAQTWAEYCENCRSLEETLREAGEDF